MHVQEVKDPNEEAQYVADEIEKRAELGISYERWQSFSAFIQMRVRLPKNFWNGRSRFR